MCSEGTVYGYKEGIGVLFVFVYTLCCGATRWTRLTLDGLYFVFRCYFFLSFFLMHICHGT